MKGTQSYFPGASFSWTSVKTVAAQCSILVDDIYCTIIVFADDARLYITVGC